MKRNEKDPDRLDVNRMSSDELGRTIFLSVKGRLRCPNPQMQKMSNYDNETQFSYMCRQTTHAWSGNLRPEAYMCGYSIYIYKHVYVNVHGKTDKNRWHIKSIIAVTIQRGKQPALSWKICLFKPPSTVCSTSFPWRLSIPPKAPGCFFQHLICILSWW